MTRLAGCNFEGRVLESFEDFAADVEAALDGAGDVDLVVLPELFTLGLVSLSHDWEAATAGSELARSADFTEPFLELVEHEARTRGLCVVAGSHLVRENRRLVNRTFVFGPDGLVATHDKTHLFVAEAAAGIQENEDLGVVELPFGTIGIAICYEAQIPELTTALVDRGADIIVCPSYTVTESGFWRVRRCLAARCVENQIFAVHAGTYGGPFGPVPGAWGRSSVLSPCHAPWPADGVVAEAPANAPGAAVADVSLDDLYTNREVADVLPYKDRRRRADLYASWHDGATHS